jgi:hypothetical protein
MGSSSLVGCRSAPCAARTIGPGTSAEATLARLCAARTIGPGTSAEATLARLRPKTDESAEMDRLYSLNASNCGSFASTKSTRSGTRARSLPNFPGLSRFVAMKIKGPDTTPLSFHSLRWLRTA